MSKPVTPTMFRHPDITHVHGCNPHVLLKLLDDRKIQHIPRTNIRSVSSTRPQTIFGAPWKVWPSPLHVWLPGSPVVLKVLPVEPTWWSQLKQQTGKIRMYLTNKNGHSPKLACDWCDLCRLVFWRGQWDLVEHFRTLPWNFAKFRQGILWSMWCGALSADLESSETRCSCNLAEHFALRRYGERKRFQNRIESDRKIRKDTNSIE